MVKSTFGDTDRASEVGEIGPEAVSQAGRLVDSLLAELRGPLVALFAGFRVDPAGVLEFERSLWRLLMEFARGALERLFNSLEDHAPRAVLHDGEWYTRERRSPNAHVATLFGKIRLLRHPFRIVGRAVGEPLIFPLELALGLVQGFTPAAADMIGRRFAAAGASQRRVLDEIREWHCLRIGAARLRKLASALAEALEATRESCQVARVVEALRTAFAGPGRFLPVLSVGRDGITLREYRHRHFQVATAATVSVLDRAGKRMVTVYLALPPELGQAGMTAQLTSLLVSILKQWEGELPRLAYVADCGDNESGYFNKVLATMTHPRTGGRLVWNRVVDFYHASERVWTIAQALFAKKQEAGEWAVRMLRVLKRRRGGIRRLLASAAAHRASRKLGKSKAADYRKARNYLAARTGWMRYSWCRQLHIPLGSGVTESACKILFTQRLKLSGQRWSSQGAGTILKLRVALLSRTWRPAMAAILDQAKPVLSGTYAQFAAETHEIAA